MSILKRLDAATDFQKRFTITEVNDLLGKARKAERARVRRVVRKTEAGGNMPEVKPVWIDGYYESYDQAYAAAQEGMNGDLLEGIPQPVFTLDQIEKWLREEEGKWSRDRVEVFIDLLAQVQAWRTQEG